MAEDFSVKGFVYLSVDDASVRRTAAEAADAVSRQAAEASGRDAPDPEPGERAERPQTSPVRIGGGIAELRRALKDQPGAGEAAPRRRDEGDAPRLQVADFGAVVAADVRRIAEAVGKLGEGRGSKVPRSEREASSEARKVDVEGEKDRPKPPPVPQPTVARGEFGRLGAVLARRGQDAAITAARLAAFKAGLPPKLVAGIEFMGRSAADFGRAAAESGALTREGLRGVGRELKTGLAVRFGMAGASRVAAGAAAGGAGAAAGAGAAGGAAAAAGGVAALGPIGLIAAAAVVGVVVQAALIKWGLRGGIVGSSMRAVERRNDALLAMPGAEASGAIQRIDLLREVGARRRAVETGRIRGGVAEANERALQTIKDALNPVMAWLGRFWDWLIGLPVRMFARVLDNIDDAVQQILKKLGIAQNRPATSGLVITI